MGGNAISADLSNIVAIQSAVLDVAQNHAGLNWYGTTTGNLPRGIDVQGFPWLVISTPDFAGGMSGPNMQTGELPREPGASEPVWLFTVVGLFPFHPSDSRTYSTAVDAMKKLIQAYTIYTDLEGTCEQTKILDPKPVPAPMRLRGGHRVWSVEMRLRAYEQLMVQY